MQYAEVVFNKGQPWAKSWHIIYLDKHDAEKVFIDSNRAQYGFTRNGGNWQRASHESYRYLKREADEWVRANAGPQEGETWECDRYYHVDETLPELPKPGGRRAWLARFKCWPDEYGTYDFARWSAGKMLDMNKPGIRACIRFQDEELAILFRVLFL